MRPNLSSKRQCKTDKYMKESLAFMPKHNVKS
jgi:hypothetical protein